MYKNFLLFLPENPSLEALKGHLPVTVSFAPSPGNHARNLPRRHFVR
ncbi:MAG: hypothetical protein AVDCRST_MAG56-2595 [uncultured Cytophagales bacterium]|uniref:Uncharacterized protein n=1 Tax=uncultured Cytophagales bacterium TaxID=158755 RepID=A0A6J4IWZ7_9SPHI|nr:MAG: hypothetical protein AVDCRST_MAG56-2595 [uncultured Cytophagales bacterium]